MDMILIVLCLIVRGQWSRTNAFVEYSLFALCNCSAMKGKSEEEYFSFQRFVCSFTKLLMPESIYCMISASNSSVSSSSSSSQSSGTQQHSPLLRIEVSSSHLIRESEKGQKSCRYVYTRAAQSQDPQRSKIHAPHSVPSSTSGPKSMR